MRNAEVVSSSLTRSKVFLLLFTVISSFFSVKKIFFEELLHLIKINYLITINKQMLRKKSSMNSCQCSARLPLTVGQMQTTRTHSQGWVLITYAALGAVM